MVYFLQPMLAQPGVLAECSVTHGHFVVSSADSAAEPSVTGTHSSGSCSHQGTKAWQEVDHSMIRVHLTDCLDVEAVYTLMATGGTTFGPDFRRLSKAWRSRLVCFGQLQARPSQRDVVVHPADLDAGVSMKPILLHREQVGLPFAMDDALLQDPVKLSLWPVR